MYTICGPGEPCDICHGSICDYCHEYTKYCECEDQS